MKKRRVLLFLLILLLLVGIPTGLLVRDYRHEQTNRDLIAAIKAHDLNAVSAALKAGTDPNALGESSEGRPEFAPPWLDHGYYIPALSLYFDDYQKDDVRFAQVLIDAGANPNYVSEDNGETPIMAAAYSNCPNMLRYLLEHGGKVNQKDREGHTPLHVATWIGEEPTICVLFDAGANIEAEDNEGNAPLHAACASGNPRALRLLLNRHVQVNRLNKMGLTPLDLAEQATWGDTPKEDVVKVLRKAGARTAKELDTLAATPPKR